MASLSADSFGKVTIIQGDPGEGKTTLALQSNCKSWPVGEAVLPLTNRGGIESEEEAESDRQPVNVL